MNGINRERVNLLAKKALAKKSLNNGGIMKRPWTFFEIVLLVLFIFVAFNISFVFLFKNSPVENKVITVVTVPPEDHSSGVILKEGEKLRVVDSFIIKTEGSNNGEEEEIFLQIGEILTILKVEHFGKVINVIKNKETMSESFENSFRIKENYFNHLAKISPYGYPLEPIETYEDKHKRNVIYKSDKDVAIVIALKHSEWYDSNCFAYKLKHFINTIDLEKYDIYFFVDKAPLNNTDHPHDLPEGVFVHFWEEIPLPHPKHWKVFAGNPRNTGHLRKGYPKIGYLDFLINSTYTHAWHIESDIVFMGPWNYFLEPYENVTDDIITYIGAQAKFHSDFWQFKRPLCEENPKTCLVMLWNVCRMSRRFAEVLMRQMHFSSGLHEMWAASICALDPDCQITKMMGEQRGKISLRHADIKYKDDDHPELDKRGCCEFGFYYKSPDINDIFDVRKPDPLKLYHPIKCITEKEGEYTWIGEWLKEEFWKDAYEKAIANPKPWPKFVKTGLMQDHLKYNEHPALTFDHSKKEKRNLKKNKSIGTPKGKGGTLKKEGKLGLEKNISNADMKWFFNKPKLKKLS